MKIQKEDSTSKNFIPLTEWSKYHSWPPIGGLRHLVFHADKNGFSSVIRRVGRRVLISEPAFFDWVEKQNNSKSEV